MIGLPPTAGFLGKWFMLSGRDADRPTGCRSPSSSLSTVLNAGYFLPIVVPRVLPRQPPRSDGARTSLTTHGEAPWPMVLALTRDGGRHARCCSSSPDIPLALAQTR